MKKYGVVSIGTNRNFQAKWLPANIPSPTVLTVPQKENAAGWVELGYYDEVEASMNKPTYRVPLMSEIEQFAWNGYNVVSTFSGCGGSCLGYRISGYKVRWANEFIPEAQETYRANHPTSILNTKDIRKVQPKDILDATGLALGEIDIFDGSPPCSAFSTAGKREAGWGKVKSYSDSSQRVDDLFFEYARLIKGTQPKVFVAENVSGLVKGTAKGYFIEILKALKDCGYEVSAKLLDAQWLGVPQARQRIIFIGVRNDLVKKFNVHPVHPTPLPYHYTVREALPWIVKHGIHPAGTFTPAYVSSSSSSAPAILASGPTGGAGLVEAVRAIHDTSGQFSVGDITDRPCVTVTTSQHLHIETETKFTKDTDLEGYAIGKEWDQLKPGESTYYGGRLHKPSLDKPSLDKPSPTVTAMSGASPGTSGVTHPTERRKFTIAELKRICAFPDDFIFTGSFAQQWERMGRAVPPVMMSHVARTIQTQILDKCKE